MAQSRLAVDGRHNGKSQHDEVAPVEGLDQHAAPFILFFQPHDQKVRNRHHDQNADQPKRQQLSVHRFQIHLVDTPEHDCRQEYLKADGIHFFQRCLIQHSLPANQIPDAHDRKHREYCSQ